jgi:hypothetical protein
LPAPNNKAHHFVSAGGKCVIGNLHITPGLPFFDKIPGGGRVIRTPDSIHIRILKGAIGYQILGDAHLTRKNEYQKKAAFHRCPGFILKKSFL